uniref:Uncharacterized protein n=1 Tax=Triticum urartu TaxID=4572 RepID=A0A8R7RBG8_TRIUA
GVGVVGGVLQRVVPQHAVAAGAREHAAAEERDARDAALRGGVDGPVEEAVGHDGVGAVVGQEPVEGLPEKPDRLVELVAVVLGREGRAVLDARREPDVWEGHDGDVDGRGASAGEGVVGPVDGRADDSGVDGRGEDGAPDAAAGEERGHVGDRDEVAGRQEREEEDMQRLVADSHGRGASRVP